MDITAHTCMIVLLSLCVTDESSPSESSKFLFECYVSLKFITITKQYYTFRVNMYPCKVKIDLITFFWNIALG